jgi:hypothetical protein
MKTKFKLWHRILLVAIAGTVPMVAITVYVISTSINKDIAFGEQEKRGNTYQRPLETLLNLVPQHQAAARRVLGGDADAKNQLSQLQHQIDDAFSELGNVQRELGEILKFTDAELAARKRENARLSVVQADWQALKNAPIATAAGDDATSKLVAAVRTMITHAGDTSNLILDPDLDSYYLMDVTLCALPQTQDRLSTIILQVGEWLRNGQAVSNKTDIAVMAAMLRQSDQDRITGDIQTVLSEDKNFYGISESLQKNLPAANEKYVAANQAFLAMLDRVISGENVPDAKTFEATGWTAREESFRFWQSAVSELDHLLVTRVGTYRQHRLVSYVSIAAVLAMVTLIIWVIAHKLNVTFRTLGKNLQDASGEVGAAAKGIAAASQRLAEGASEQAASLEETSASLEEISHMTKRNADNASNSTSLSRQARDSASAGLDRLAEMGRTLSAIKSAVGEMQSAVSDMQSSSQEISKIIKTIDEIAFQTNLLALNAAVEAARAGEAGAGFAVVADEVRALARRSAQAAKDTSEKIEAAVKRSELGGIASTKVVKSLGEVEATAHNIEQVFNGIVGQIKSLDEVIAEIAGASKEQSQGVSEVNMAVSQMDKITQSNAGSAEENASAAEELNAQVASLQSVVVELQTVVSGKSRLSEDSSETSEDRFEIHSLKPLPAKRTAGKPSRSVTPKPAAATLSRADIPMPAPLGAEPTAGGFKDF